MECHDESDRSYVTKDGLEKKLIKDIFIKKILSEEDIPINTL